MELRVNVKSVLNSTKKPHKNRNRLKLFTETKIPYARLQRAENIQRDVRTLQLMQEVGGYLLLEIRKQLQTSLNWSSETIEWPQNWRMINLKLTVTQPVSWFVKSLEGGRSARSSFQTVLGMSKKKQCQHLRRLEPGLSDQRFSQ